MGGDGASHFVGGSTLAGGSFGQSVLESDLRALVTTTIVMLRNMNATTATTTTTTTD